MIAFSARLSALRVAGFLGLFLPAATALSAAESVKIEDSVVMIRSVTQPYNWRTPWKQQSMKIGVGSGFIIEGKRILTNAHNVVDGKYVEVTLQGSARRYPSRVEFIGHDCDLAILVPMDSSFFDGTRPLEIGGIPEVNSTVSTYGFPIGGQHVSVTEGVVSRIQMDLYTLTAADQHLVIQTDAAINPGNSGGPVVQDGKVVGVAFQGLTQADNIGYLIPTTVMRHFLKDIADGAYDGYGSLGFSYFAGLHNPSYKKYLKVPEGEEGLVVTRTLLNSSVEGVLDPVDVVTRIGGHDIDNDGMIRLYGLRVHMSEAIERKQMGEAITLTFFRGGERHEASVKVALNRPVLEFGRQYDKPPRYIVYAGLTFVVLSRNVLETWGENWVTDIPDYLRYLVVHAAEVNRDPKRKEYVLLSEVMPDEVNAYAGSFKNRVLKTVNGVVIRSLDDIAPALEKSKDGFCVFTFMDQKRPLVLKAEEAAARRAVILEKYNIPADRRLEG